MNIKVWFGRLVPWVATVAIFSLLLRRISLEQVVESLTAVNWPLYLLLMAPYSVAYFLLDSAAVTWVVRRFHVAVRYREILPVRAVTYVLALVNSSVGQGGLALWLHRREAVPLVAMAGTVLFLGVLEIFNLVLVSSVGVFFAGTTVPGLERAYIVLYSVIAATLLYFNLLPLLGLRRPVPGLLATFGRASLLDWFVILAIKASSLTIAVLVHATALRLWGLPIPLEAMLANLPLIFLASAIPLTVAKLGTSQAAWIFLLGAWAPEASLLAYSLVAHLVFLVLNALIGVAFLPTAGAEIGALMRRPAEPD